MKICSLASGSKGNCTVIYNDKQAILIDCGISCKDLELKAKLIGLDLSIIKGIFVTHEHIDHIKGIKTISQKYKTPVFASEHIYADILYKAGRMPNLDCKKHSEGIQIDDFFVNSFRVPHDANYTVGYNVYAENKKISTATDLGVVNSAVKNALLGSDIVLLESNHDELMLQLGRYPQPLKARIKSNTGHLSNEQAGELAVDLIKGGTSKIILAHLSEDNNTPENAFNTVNKFLTNNLILEGKDVNVEIALQYRPSKIIEV